MKKNPRIKAEILAVGSELLTPSFVDTNTPLMIAKLNEIGIDVAFRTIVGDDWEDLVGCLHTAWKRSRLILVSGGLGPTEDDRTREAAAKVLKRKLVFFPEIEKAIRRRFRRRGIDMPGSNRKQCYALEGAEILANPNGTAPGLWICRGGRKMALLPGPPHELEPMLDKNILPRIRKQGSRGLYRRTLRLAGISESFMEDRLLSLYPKIPQEIRITTLARPGDLRIILEAIGDRDPSEDLLRGLENKILNRLGEYVYSRGPELEEIVSGMLRERGKTVACAESCTGGLISHRLTNVPGSSRCFLKATVAYSDSVKMKDLGVSKNLLRKYGAVSESVAEAMARGIIKYSDADFGLAVTGIAGPGGGTPLKPVGLVYTALASKSGRRVRVLVEKNFFTGKREFVKFQSSQKALDMLRRQLESESGPAISSVEDAL